MLIGAFLAGPCLAGEPPPAGPLFRDADSGFTSALPESWVGLAGWPEDLKKRMEVTADKFSTAQAAQLKPLAVYLRPPYSAHRQLTSMRIDWIDDPSVAGLDPMLLMQSALLSIKKQDPDFRLLEAPRAMNLEEHRGGTFSIEHTSVYAKTLDKSGITRARLWFFAVGGAWIKVNLTAAKEEWEGIEKEFPLIEKGFAFTPPPPPKKAADEILDGLKRFR